MAYNRGKQFEGSIINQFKKLKDTFVLRLYDVTTGFKNQNNPCDVIVFKRGVLCLFELKSVHGSTLNFKSHIRENQWEKMLKYSGTKGVNVGVICWFIDYDKTIYTDIEYLDEWRKQGNKSLNVTKDLLWVPNIEIIGKKKRVFYDYNLEKFLEDIRYER